MAFQFGEEKPVQPGTDAYETVDSVTQTAVNVLDISGAPDADASGMVSSIIRLPELLAIAMDGSASGFETKDSESSEGGEPKTLSALLAQAGDARCITVSPAEIVFTDCTQTTTGEDGSSTTKTMNGSFQRAAGHVSWDVTMVLTITDTAGLESVSWVVTGEQTGDLTFADGSLKGSQRADVAEEVTQGSKKASQKATYHTALDLRYQTDPTDCITGGTITARLLWVEKPSGTGVDPKETEEAKDQALRFTWTGCGVVTVAEGTRQ